MRRRQGLVLILGAAISGLCATDACAHGDGHADAVGPEVIAPRAEARIGPFELVVVFSDPVVAVFVNRFGSGVPVKGAKIEASTDLQSAALTETDAGLYVTKELLLAHGNNPIEIKLIVDGVTSTQAMMLVVPAEGPAPASAASASGSVGTVALIGGSVAATLALTAGGFAATRRSARGGVPITEP